MFGLKLWC